MLVEFVETLEAHHSIHNPDDDSITIEEWIEYLTDIGSPIEDDQQFITMVQNTFDCKEEYKRKMNVAQSVKSFSSKPMDYRPGHERQTLL